MFRHSLAAILAVCTITAAPLAAQGTIKIGGGGTMSISLGSGNGSNPQQSGNLIATLKNAGNFKTFLELVNLAGLNSTFEGSAQYTVFAPTDAAFEAVPAEKLSALKSDTAALKKMVLYHVISSTIPSNQILKLKTARTVSGPRVEFVMKEGQVRIGDAVVIQPDLKASNGVVHGINKVLLPK